MATANKAEINSFLIIFSVILMKFGCKDSKNTQKKRKNDEKNTEKEQLLLYFLLKAVHQPLFLLRNGHVTVVEFDGIVGFTQRTYLTM